MCGRYTRKSDKQAIATAFHVNGNITEEVFGPDDDVRPHTMQPIIVENRDTGLRDLEMGLWGLRRPNWKKVKGQARPPINARSGNAMDRWRGLFATGHRAIVPADSFYEWHHIRKSNNPKYEFQMKNNHPFALAALFSGWKDPETNQWLRTFTILTTDPNEVMEPIHDRMPVILHPRDYARWLSRDKTDQPPIDLLRPFEADEMIAHLSGNSQDEMFVEPNSK